MSKPNGTRTPHDPNRYNSILEESASIFRRQGYHATSLQDVADAVGIQKGSLYHHFDSKEDILFQIIEETHKATIEANVRWQDLPVGDLQRLEARFPFGRYAEQAQLELIYAHYMSYNPDAARSAADRKELMTRLEHLPRIEIDGEVERLALLAQRELAEVGHHRLAPMDVILAACAHSAATRVSSSTSGN